MDQRHQKSGICRIAITGPESTGKSMLAAALAQHFNTAWVPEYARTYLRTLDRPYNYDDISIIACGQIASEKSHERFARNVLFCDTECIVTKIWSEFKYQRCDAWINHMIVNHPYDLYLLCDVDLPWEFDPLREHPDQRQILFELYRKELETHHFKYGIVKGTGKLRFERALSIIRKHGLP